MSLNFPPSANTGDIYTSGNASYEFTGTKWKPVNRVDYTVQASDIVAANNELVIDFDVDGIQRLALSEEAVVTFAGTENLNEYKRVLVEFSIDPAYVDTTTLYDIANSSFEAGKIKSVEAQDPYPLGLFFKPDGTKMYMVGFTNKTVYQYALSVAWDVSSAVFETGKIKSVAAQETTPHGLFFKPDGLKMYTVGEVNKTVYQYTLSVAWDVSSAVFETGKIKSVAQEQYPTCVFFKPDGLKMYIIGYVNKTVYQYTLSVAWDVSTAVLETGKTKSVAAQDASPMKVFFKSDGTKMYMVGFTNKTVYQYALSVAWDVSSAVFETGKIKSVEAQDASPRGLFFKSDDTKMYIIGDLTDTVYQYNIYITTQDTIANVTWPAIVEWGDGYAPSLPNPQETALIELEARTDYLGTNYVGRLVGRNF